MTVREYLTLKATSQSEKEIKLLTMRSKTNVPLNRAMIERYAEKAYVCSDIYKTLLSVMPVEALDMELYSEVMSNAE